MLVTRSVDKQASEILAEFKSTGILEEMRGPDMRVNRIDAVEQGGAGALVFVGDAEQVEMAKRTAPAAIVTRTELAAEFGDLENTAVLTSANVKLAHALIRQVYADRDVRRTEWDQIHPSAVIHESVTLAQGVIIGPGVVLGADVEIGRDTVIMANTVVETGVRIGAETVIHPNVVVAYDCSVGDRVIIKSGCIIGMEGFGFAEDKQGKRYRIPQLGRVVIEDDVVLGANCNIDRATYAETRIGKGCKMDALCHIAHNVSMDENCVIVAQSGIAGSTHLGKRVILSGQTAIIDHVSIADDVALVHRAGVMSSIDEPGVYAGIPTQPMKDYFKNVAVAQRLVELRKKLQSLEKQVAKMTSPE